MKSNQFETLSYLSPGVIRCSKCGYSQRDIEDKKWVCGGTDGEKCELASYLNEKNIPKNIEATNIFWLSTSESNGE